MKKHRSNISRIITFVAVFFLFPLAFISNSLSNEQPNIVEIDITDTAHTVQIVSTDAEHRLDTGVSLTDVTIRNSSLNIIPAPFRIVIENISESGVTVANADGTYEGKPYFEYDAYGGVLEGNAETESKEWQFNNSQQQSFSIEVAYQSQLETDDMYFPTSTPEEQGFDSEGLKDVIRSLIDDDADVHSILMVRNGKIFLEAYKFPYNRDRLHNVASVTKSFMSAMTGIVMDQGNIQSLDETVFDYFPQYFTGEEDARAYDVTLHHLLSMTSGYDLSDYNPIVYDIQNRDYIIKEIIPAPMSHAPGEHCLYSSLGSYLMGAILQEAMGTGLKEFSEQYLFGPMGVDEVYFQEIENSETYDSGDGQMYITPQSMAKFGQLFLNGGTWEGQQVVPSDWVTLSTSNQIGNSTIHNPYDMGLKYGYQWWLKPLNVYCAFGFGGQTILLNNDEQVAIIVTRADPDDALVDSLYYNPSVFASRNEPLPANPSGVESLNQAIQDWKYPKVSSVPAPPAIADQISGASYAVDESGTIFDGRVLTFDFNRDNSCEVSIVSEGNEAGTLIIGLDGIPRLMKTQELFWELLPATTLPEDLKYLAATGEWIDDTTFLMDVNPVGYPIYVTYTFEFTNAGVTVSEFSRPDE